ncbi:GNAT family N-acetyltransferase [Microvirga subterranea]|uniref:Acetyltransferase (GNAT) family protein n=1 Tax=Microvirga subterranea TaxID=186651 RepID=A0A370HV18_9HYPH|nr:GNAT family N-acetyltransferase [Microvirga subterranea]RDI62245.1 acetyltransferase (GNAT) family protein [Microvirga subterranea]
MTLFLRAATPADVRTLFAIRTAVRENHMSLDELVAAGVTPDSVADLVQSPDAGTWIGLWDGEPAGFAMARQDPGDVFALFVLPEMEERGVGRALLTQAEAWLASRGLACAWLLTGGGPGLRAAAFYEARGWVAAGREHDGQIRFTKRLAASSVGEETHFRTR